MTLTEKLNSYGAQYWDFSQFREKEAAIKYPAMMVAPMQKEIIKDILEDTPQVSNILDPFMGSGTALSAGAGFGLDVTGIDINPLAALITKVRLEGVPTTQTRRSIAAIKTNITLLQGNVAPYQFMNISKWFREDVICDLSIIRSAIQLEPDLRIRRFFWVCFSDAVRKYCNSRTSTFKLHTKEENKITCMDNDLKDYFIDKISKAYINYAKDSKRVNSFIYTGNSIEILSKMKSNTYDLICTSPPYGDNHTTVTYGQYSILPLLWIVKEDLDPFDPKLTSTFSAIDRESLGGEIHNPTNSGCYDDLLSAIGKEKKKKVESFCYDYEQVFVQMARILKHGKRMVLTLGNRRVDNCEVPFDAINDRMAEKYGLRSEVTITRNILGKRMPSKVSCIKNCGSVNSMSKEYIKVYTKL